MRDEVANEARWLLNSHDTAQKTWESLAREHGIVLDGEETIRVPVDIMRRICEALSEDDCLPRADVVRALEQMAQGCAEVGCVDNARGWGWDLAATKLRDAADILSLLGKKERIDE